MDKKKYNHKLRSVEHNFKFQCDDEKLFKQVEQFLAHAINPKKTATADKVTPARSTYPYPLKSPEALAYRCIAMHDPQRKIMSIREMRNIAGYGLADAKEWCEGTRVLALDAHEAAALWQLGFVLQML
jgi:ribosomal protein L7/L12